METKTKVISKTDHKEGISRKNGKEWSCDTFLFSDEKEYPLRFVADVWKKDLAEWLYQHAGKGEDISVSFDIDAREYNGRWYNTVRVFRVTLNGRDVLSLTEEEERENELLDTMLPQMTTPTQAQQQDYTPDDQSELPF